MNFILIGHCIGKMSSECEHTIVLMLEYYTCISVLTVTLTDMIYWPIGAA